MLLGAGRGQIPILNICHKYGWKVLAVTPRGDYPAIELADNVEFCDVKEKDFVLNIAIKYKIEAIVSDQLDVAVTTCAYVAEKLGLPGNKYSVAEKFVNKQLMLDCAEKLGIDIPRKIVITNLDGLTNILYQNKMEFPLIMKPLDSAASKGVVKVESMSDIESKFGYTKSFSSNGSVIIEEFIQGEEYVVEAYTRNYATTNLMVGHRCYFNISNAMIPRSTIFVDAESASSNDENNLKANHKKLVDGFGLKFGITHGEYIVQKGTGKVFLVEIAARGGGVFISSHLIPLATGVHADEMLVQDALGIDVGESMVIGRGAAAYMCYLLPIGKIVSISNKEAVCNIQGVSEVFFDNVHIGMETSSALDKRARKGPIIIFGKNRSDCIETMNRIKNTLDIKVQTPQDERGIIWY